MNRYYPHTIIAQEGWLFIIGGLVLSVLFTCLCGWWSLPFWAFTLFCVNFFRDPARNIPEAPDAILSPADGRVVVVERAIDPYRQTSALKISIFMNIQCTFTTFTYFRQCNRSTVHRRQIRKRVFRQIQQRKRTQRGINDHTHRA